MSLFAGTGAKGGKFGPKGVDLFAQQCRESLGVPRVEQYDTGRQRRLQGLPALEDRPQRRQGRPGG